MRKVILIVALILFSVQSCLAAEISSARVNNDEKLIYPVVHVADSEIENKINEEICCEILGFIRRIQEFEENNGFEALDVRTSYEIGSNEAGNTIILSILITESSYFKGAAHPSTYLRTLNFNLASGELMGLDYLIEVGDGFQDGYLLERLNQKLRGKVEREEIFLFEDALPLKKLPETFYWDKNLHVHFLFNQYEIAPYAAGIIDVDIDE